MASQPRVDVTVACLRVKSQVLYNVHISSM